MTEASSVVELQSSDELKEIINSGAHVIIDYTASWCGPCKRFAPVFDRLAAEYMGVGFYKADVDNLKITHITAVPTFELYRDGSLVGSSQGANKDAVLVLLSK
jgi:thioredoxin 1